MSKIEELKSILDKHLESGKDKFLAPSKTNKIKALESKMQKNLAGVGAQIEMIFEVEVEKEINGIQMGVLKGGIP